MAGRGTDIVLGGSPEMLAKLEFKEQGKDEDVDKEEFEGVIKRYEASSKKEGDEVREVGGLHIVGTERHESRRIDNQLRGRAGRQGQARKREGTTGCRSRGAAGGVSDDLDDLVTGDEVDLLVLEPSGLTQEDRGPVVFAS